MFAATGVTKGYLLEASVFGDAQDESIVMRSKSAPSV